jgi:hypothetical protein
MTAGADRKKHVREARSARAALTAWFLSLFFLAASGSVPAMADVYMFRDDGGSVYFTNVPGAGRFKVRLPLKEETAGVKKNLKAVARQIAPDTTKLVYEPVIATAGELFAVDPHLIRAVIKAESNFNPQAVSLKGASGLMQLMPATAEDLGVADPFDPVENILGGTKYLSRLLDALDGNLPLALAAYNAGPLRVIGKNRIPHIPETRDYVERVLRYYGKYNQDK